MCLSTWVATEIFCWWPVRHIVFMITYVLYRSCFCEIWAPCVLWIFHIYVYIYIYYTYIYILYVYIYICIYTYINIHVYMIYVSGHKWFTTQRVLNKQNKEHNIVLSEHSLVLAMCITCIWYTYNMCICNIYIYIYIIYSLSNLSNSEGRLSFL